MTTFLVFVAGLVVGVVYHAFLQPYVSQFGVWAKGVIGRIGTRKDAE